MSSMMLFIDESGDCGFQKASSPYFVLALVAVRDDLVRALDTEIESLKTKYHIFPEYKFAKTSDSHKAIFFDAVSTCDFDAYAVVINKSLVYSNELRKNSKKFYSFCLKQLLQHLHLEQGTKIRIDASSSKIFQREAKVYVRKQFGDFPLDIKFFNSKSANLIQLADMVAGAICRQYAFPAKSQWKQKIDSKIKGIWEVKKM